MEIIKHNKFKRKIRVWIIVQNSVYNNFPSETPVSALRTARQLRQFATYHLCFWEVIYMWCTYLNWENKRNLPWEYQALKPALCPHANALFPDKQNATDRYDSHLNVAMYQSHKPGHNVFLFCE